MRKLKEMTVIEALIHARKLCRGCKTDEVGLDGYSLRSNDVWKFEYQPGMGSD